jgi:putative ABC transport system permease protein
MRMWRVTLRDLVFRRRRFLIAVVVTAIVFGLTLVLDGLVENITHESDHIVGLFDADQWLVAEGGSGPFTTTRLLLQDVVGQTKAQPGVTEASAFIQARESVDGQDVNVLGVDFAGLGQPPLTAGRLPSAAGEVVADETVHHRLGDVVRLGGTDATIVGMTRDLAYYFGGATIFASLHDVQTRYLGGQPLVSGIAIRGATSAAPAGTRLLSPAEVVKDLNRPAGKGVQTVQVINVLLWFVAGGIVASMVYLSTLERVRDLAVFKAIGTSTRSLFAGLAIQALALSVAAALGGAVVAALLAPVFPLPVDIPARSYVELVVIAIVLGLIASLIGLRRATKVDPALAFGR